MAKEPRKPLRERVAERKQQEAERARKLGVAVEKPVGEDRPQSEEVQRRAREAVRWHQVQTVGNVMQWGALLALIVEIYFVWTADPNEETRWTWIIAYAVIFGVGRVVKTLGAAQLKRYR